MAEFRTAYGPKPKVRITCGKGLTKQSMKKDCDINFIVKQFQKTGVVEHAARYNGDYGAFENAPNFHEAMNIVAEANSMFESVPSNVRTQFDNDPGKFLAFATDPANRDGLVELGLAKALPASAPAEPDGPAPETLPAEPPAA